MSAVKIREKLRLLPKEPGCYLMKDALGRIIYVGKAKNLKARVSQYFNIQVDSHKTRVLVEHIADFELIITQNEIEALLLERTLIKHHKPRFNVLLRDDKEYPFLRINFNEDWPRIEKVRRRKDDGATYLGPFSNSGQLRILVDAALRIFPLVRCSRHEFAHARRPCNYYHMKMCMGPCKLPVPQEQYKATVQDAVHFLSGKNHEVTARLKQKMEETAAHENFELAAMYRDQLKAFAAVTEKQNVVTSDISDADVVGLEQRELKTAFHVLTVRNFQLVGQDSFLLRSEIASREEALSQFLLQYYESRSLPKDLLLPFPIDDSDELRLALMLNHPEASSFHMHIPSRGSKKELVEMAQKNAVYKINEMAIQNETSRTELMLLQEKFSLRQFPRRMECIDISNTQGSAIVASNVCFIDGRPSKEHYRHYNITTVQGGPDDFKSIAEVVERRLVRALRDGDMPQLLIIDGGRGQLSSALQAFHDFYARQSSDTRSSMPPCDLISLAKAKGQTPRGGRARHGPERAFERVFLPGKEVPLLLHPGTPEFRLLTQIRDEAHRFAITHHRKSRSKAALESPLMEIPGIGRELQKKLLAHYGSIRLLCQATLDDLLKFKGLRHASAVALHSYLQNLEEASLPQQSDMQAASFSQETPHMEPVIPHTDPNYTFRQPTDHTFEIAIRIVNPMSLEKKHVEDFLINHGFPDFVEAMIDGLEESLPDEEKDEESLWIHLENPSLPVCVYHHDRAVIDNLQAELQQTFGSNLQTKVTPLHNDSWQKAWQPSLTPIVTPRFEVRPLDSSHTDFPLFSPAERPIILTIPSHQNTAESHEVFGDGRHGTTEACLRILAQLPLASNPLDVALDVGTGSGILALALGLLGYKHVVLTDLDDTILGVAQRHLDLNKNLFHSGNRPHWYPHITSEIPPPPQGSRYQIITANILAPVLHRLLPDMVAALDPQGWLLLSGFIEKEWHSLLAAVQACGLECSVQESCRGWMGVLLRKVSANHAP